MVTEVFSWQTAIQVIFARQSRIAFISTQLSHVFNLCEVWLPTG